MTTLLFGIKDVIWWPFCFRNKDTIIVWQAFVSDEASCNILGYKTTTLVYKFLHNGHPSYFGPLLSTRCGRYSTRYNHPDKRLSEVPQFCPSVHKSKNNFGHSFAFDAPTVWNHLPDEVRSAPTLACFRKRLKLYLFKKAFPT